MNQIDNHVFAVNYRSGRVLSKNSLGNPDRDSQGTFLEVTVETMVNFSTILRLLHWPTQYTCTLAFVQNIE